MEEIMCSFMEERTMEEMSMYGWEERCVDRWEGLWMG